MVDRFCDTPVDIRNDKKRQTDYSVEGGGLGVIAQPERIESLRGDRPARIHVLSLVAFSRSTTTAPLSNTRRDRSTNRYSARCCDGPRTSARCDGGSGFCFAATAVCRRLKEQEDGMFNVFSFAANTRPIYEKELETTARSCLKPDWSVMMTSFQRSF